LRVLTPAYLLRLWWRGRREPLYRHALAERLGYGQARAARGGLWLHAVSLGETRAAAPLIDALRAQRPGLRLLLTHGTATGREAGAALLQTGDLQTWLPYDTPAVVERFFRHFRPAVGVLMETEVWPNLMRGAAEAGVPVLLANARLGERSLRRGERFAVLLKPAFASLTRALAQTQADAQRLRLAGARQPEVMGNLKFDMTPHAGLLLRGEAWSRGSGVRPVVLAASTREGEEGPLLDAWRAGQALLPDATGSLLPRPRLLVVPRHPQRFDEVAALVQRAGLSLSRRSEWPDGLPDTSARRAEVWLGDSIGELAAYYGCARVALLGGSFAPLGGQNLIEAAACGCPILLGPHTFNFAEAAELAIAAGAARRVIDIAQGVRRALSLANDPPARSQMSRDGLAFAAAHRGAAERMAGAIVELLPEAA
jgi:3-deoxy-D-manno-octulosonic-acid transferase